MSENHSPTQPVQSHVRRGNFRPAAVYVALMLVFDLLFFPMIATTAWTGLPFTVVYSTLEGVVAGQVCIVILLASLYGREWTVGLCVGSAISIAGMLMFVFGQALQYRIMVPFSNSLWAVFLIPAVILCASLPLYAIRFLRGWYLTASPAGASARVSGIEDLLINTAVVASVLFLARVPVVAWELNTSQFWGPVAMALGILMGVSLLIVTPATIIAFRIDQRRRRRLALFGFAGCMLLAVNMFVAVPAIARDGSAFGLAEVLIPRSAMTISGLATGLLGIWALRASGLRLMRTASALPQQDERIIQAARGGRRAIAMAIFSISLVCSLLSGLVVHRRHDADLRHAELAQQLTTQGGSVRIAGHQVRELVLGPASDDAVVKYYLDFRQLSSLSLANTQISDTCLDDLVAFPRLTKLDLSGTKISSSAVPKLMALPWMSELSVARTQLTVDDVRQLLAKNSLIFIDLSHLDLTVSDLANLLWRQHRGVALRGYGFDDATMRRVLILGPEVPSHVAVPNAAMSISGRLDLSDNPIDGSCLTNQSSYLDELRLDNTALTDAAFGKVVAGLNTGLLCLSNTLLTDAILPALAKAPGIRGLELGDGQITEAGLAATQPMNLSRLVLRSRQFTGSCFQQWQPSLYQLDMSHSGINDETVGYLSNLPNCQSINLSHTQLTDAALPKLAKLGQWYEIDITSTRVSAKGLAQGHLKGLSRVVVGINQFAPEQVKRLRQIINLEVGGQLDRQ